MLARIALVLILFLSLVLTALWWSYDQALTTSVVSGQSRIIEIAKGDSFKQITHKLLAEKINISPFWFKLIAYNKKVSNKLKAGEYELKIGLTIPQILDLFVDGKSRQYSITFPEGWNFKQMLEHIQNNPYLKKSLEQIDYKTIMEKLGAQYTQPEGLFFPDTYFFIKNASDLSLLKTAYQRMQKILSIEWDNREDDLPLKNAYEALILASIVEKETGAIEERAQIAGVFIRRLKKGMLLQTDPTVIYGMGEHYQGNIRYKDLKRATPYNTYIIPGMPPTPIAMPGKAAIHAVLHPATGKSLYFVAKGKGLGTHVFSATLRAHNNAVNKYQRNR